MKLTEKEKSVIIDSLEYVRKNGLRLDDDDGYDIMTKLIRKVKAEEIAPDETENPTPDDGDTVNDGDATLDASPEQPPRRRPVPTKRKDRPSRAPAGAA